MFNKAKNRILTACLMTALAASNALAVDPTSLAEVGSATTAEITSNKPMLFAIMGGVMLVAVALMIFRRGKGVAR